VRGKGGEKEKGKGEKEGGKEGKDFPPIPVRLKPSGGSRFQQGEEKQKILSLLSSFTSFSSSFPIGLV